MSELRRLAGPDRRAGRRGEARPAMMETFWLWACVGVFAALWLGLCAAAARRD
jgi:hypothetical protein